MGPRRALALVLLLAPLLGAGCASVVDMTEKQRVYGGVRLDTAVLMIPQPARAILPLGALKFFAACDLPLSLAADTALLPVTAPLAGGRAVYYGLGDPAPLVVEAPGFRGEPRRVRLVALAAEDERQVAEGEAALDSGPPAAWRPVQVPAGRLILVARTVPEQRFPVRVRAGDRNVLALPRPGRLRVDVASAVTRSASVALDVRPIAAGAQPARAVEVARADVPRDGNLALRADLEPGAYDVSVTVRERRREDRVLPLGTVEVRRDEEVARALEVRAAR